MKWDEEKLDKLLDFMSEWPEQLMARRSFHAMLRCCGAGTPVFHIREEELSARIEQLERRIRTMGEQTDAIEGVLKELSLDLAELRHTVEVDC